MILNVKKIPRSELRKIKAVFFDIDDTFSGGNYDDPEFEARIGQEAFASLWKLHKAGIKLIPVTGRPAGWCDMIARMFPVDAIVGENGAFYMQLIEGGHGKPAIYKKRYLEKDSVRKSNAKKLDSLKKNIFKKFPNAKTPSDQKYREFDLAIDYCEDVKRWKDQDVQKLMNECKKYGAQVKLSSIHVNTWFGKYDKWTCVQKVMKEVLKLSPKSDLNKVAYLGDSPNDEPFFKVMPFTVGVANVSKFLMKMKSHPKYIATYNSGRGFAEFSKILLNSLK